MRRIRDNYDAENFTRVEADRALVAERRKNKTRRLDLALSVGIT